jgi:hypothetical protein
MTCPRPAGGVNRSRYSAVINYCISWTNLPRVKSALRAGLDKMPTCSPLKKGGGEEKEKMHGLVYRSIYYCCLVHA